MTSFFDAALGYPTAVWTALLAVVGFYWLLALVGVVDFEAGGVDLDAQLDGDIDDIGVLAGYLVAFGLNGVPFSVVVSLIVLIAWTLTCLAAMWLLPLVPTSLLRAVVGTGVLAASFAAALPVTARILRPMRGLFVTHSAVSNAALVGQTCRVLTTSVSEDFGRAEVSTRGAGVNIKVWARTPNALAKGSVARILEYDTAAERYLIEAEP